MRKNIPLAVIAALAALLLCVPAALAASVQLTYEETESADHRIITVSGSDAGENDGKDIILVESDAGENDGQEIILVEGREKPKGSSSHKVITVSDGDTVAVEGEAKDARLGYENYAVPYTVWDSNADGYDDYYDYVDSNIYNYSESYPAGAETSEISDGTYSVQSSGYDYSGGYFPIGYDDYYDGDGYYAASRGFSGTVILIAMAIGLIVAITFYASTKSSYENAGIGVVYDLKDNAVLKLAGNINRQIDTRSSIDRGYYGRGTGASSGGSLSAPGGTDLSARPGQMRPGQVRPQVPGHPGMTRPGAPNMNRPPRR